MATVAPTVTVIIPTHNRKAALQRLLDALAQQTFPLTALEVLVVADGCVDNTVAMVRAYRAPYALQIFEQAGQGAAMARNHGASYAKGRLLIFLDDDVEPAPGLVAAHVAAHQAQSGRVAIGYLPPLLTEQTGFFRSELRFWWETMFQRMRQPGHRYTYRDLLSGNCSLEATLLAQVGGFDPAFRACYDDYEWGVRLLKAGAEFVFVEAAFGYHHETRTLAGLLHRKQQEGIAEILIGRRHPELIPTLLVTHVNNDFGHTQKLLTFLVFRWPWLGDLGALVLRRLLVGLEWLHARRLWRRVLDVLLVYWHWRGVAKAVGKPHALQAFLRQSKPAPAIQEIQLDLQGGIEASEQQLECLRPSGAQLYYGSTLLGCISSEPGAEPLRGRHLRLRLATEFAKPLMKAMLAHEPAGFIPEELSWLRAAYPDR